MERIIDRFDKYMKYRGLNDNQVTVQLNASVGCLGKSRGEKRELSRRMVKLILNFYVDIEESWLLTGQGEMLKEEFKGKSIEFSDNGIELSKKRIEESGNNIEKQDDSWYKDLIKSQQDVIASQQKAISDLTSMISSQKTENHVHPDTNAGCVAVAG
jgi:hypothetical protein